MLLVLSFIIGFIPASFIIHLVQKDFSGFYFEAISFLKYHSYSYQILTNYCGNPVNTGLNARAPLVPFLMAISMATVGRNLVGIYLPFFIARLLIGPITYLAASHYLSKKFAFLASFLLVVIPKLQTYSFGSPEADIFVALFYVLAIYFYNKSNKLTKRKLVMLTGISLGLGALAKSIGLGIAVGFILAVLLENLLQLKKKKLLNNLVLFIVSFILIIGPYLLWTVLIHHQLYITTQHDKSLTYIPLNLPSLLSTIPLYLGIDFNLNLKGKIVSSMFLFFLIVGIVRAIRKKQFVLVVPTAVTLVFISMLSTCLLSGNIPANYEFITILGFTMIPAVILLLTGSEELISFIWLKMMRRPIPTIIVTGTMILILFKFINNFFSVTYVLDYIPNQFYISLPTVIKNRQQLAESTFIVENGVRIFNGPITHVEIFEKFNTYRFKPFSPFYSRLIRLAAVVTFIVLILPEKRLSRKS